MRIWQGVIGLMLVVLLSISAIGIGASEVAAQQANDVGMAVLSLDVQKDGWAQVELKALFDKELVAEWGYSQDEIVDGIKSNAEEAGFKVAPYSEGEMIGARATKQLSLVEMQDLRQIFEPDYPSEQAGPLLAIERGFFYTRYRLATDFDLGEAGGPLGPGQLRVTLPGKVTQHNANEEEDKALIWHLDWGYNPIEAEARALNPGASEVAALLANGGMAVLSLDVQENGWAQVELKALLDKEWAAEWGLSQDEMVDVTKSDAEEKGWRVASYSEGGMDGLRMTKFLSLVEMQDLRQIFQPDYPSEQAGPLLVIERGFFYTRYRLATDFDLGEAEGPLGPGQLRVTLPGKVTQHNANEEEDKALIWHLAWGPNRIEAEARAVNAAAMALVISIIVGALAGTFFAISRLSKPLAPASLSKGVRFCPHCGNSLASGDAFCNRCGTKL